MVRIGILGAAGIAPRAMILPARRRSDVEVVAVASRRQAAAERYAAQHGIPVPYGSYDDLLEDPAIDAVYVALPPSEHCAWSVRALEAGKHVLCEKPIAFDAAEARLMAAAAAGTGKRLVEAFHDRYHPLGGYLAGLRSLEVLGDIVSIDASFTASNPYDPTSIRHVPELGGGALMDLGTYPVHWIRSFMAEEPHVVSASFDPNPLGADETIAATLRFPSGATAHIGASMADGQTFSAAMRVEGTEGVLEVDNPIFPHQGHSVRVTIDGLLHTHTLGGDETYDHQLAAFVDAIETGRALPTEAEDYVANMSTIDSIYAAAGMLRHRG